jgi:hypothetical protein
MGCNTSMNIQTKEDKDDRIIKINENKENKTTKNENKENDNDNNNKDNGEYLDIESIKKIENGNTDCKTIVNNNVSKIHNLNINKNLYNYKSTNFKYLKEEQQNLHKSNLLKDNKKEISYNNTDFIALKHPLDNSSDNIEQQEQQNQVTTKKENINVTTSMEQRINNYKSGINEQIEEDEVNMGNYKDDENDDMCNFGQSIDDKKVNEVMNNQKEITIIFDIQSTGEKYSIKANKGIKLNDLIEKFKKTIDLSSFERPEFMHNGVYLIDYDKSIEDYNITDKSKINVYI